MFTSSRSPRLHRARPFRVWLFVLLPIALVCALMVSLTPPAESVSVNPRAYALEQPPATSDRQPDEADWNRAPDAAQAVVVDARNPQWITRYGTELGGQLLPPRAPDFPMAPEAYQPPLTGTWLTRTIQSGTNNVKAIVGAPDGRVFVAISGDGLRVFTPSVTTSEYAWTAIHASGGGLLSDNVNALAIINGELWVGTADWGISVLNLQTGAWHYYLPIFSPLPSSTVNRFTYVTPPALFGYPYVWVSTEGGAARITFNPGGPSWKVLRMSDGLPSNSIFDVAVRYNCFTRPCTTETYIATDASLQLWNGSSFTTINGSVASCLFDRASRVHTDRFNRLWVIPQNNVPGLAASGEQGLSPESGGWRTIGLCRYDGTSWSNYDSGSPGLPSDSVTDLAEDYAGRIWLAMDKGISANGGAAVYDKETWKFFTKANSPIYTDTTVSLVQTIGEAVWWGFRSNAVTSIYSPNWLRYTAADMSGSGTPDAIYLDSARVLIGIGNNLSWREPGDSWVARSLPGSASGVSAFANAGNLKWWVGTNGSGLYLYDDSGFLPAYTRYRTTDGLPSDSITVLLTDQQGRLWIGTPNGVALRAPGRFIAFTVSNSGLGSNLVNALAQDGAGRLWVGHNAGISIYDLNASGTNAWSSYTTANGLPSNMVTALTRDPFGNMWAGTAGGVGQWDPNSSAWLSHTVASGALPNNDVKSIASDPLGRIWVGTRYGAALRESGTWKKFHVPGTTLYSDWVGSVASDGERAWLVAGSEVAVRGVLTAPVGTKVPSIASFSPSAGSPGDLVTISGSNFDDASPNLNMVLFCGDSFCNDNANPKPVKAEVVAATSTSLSVKVPPLAASGPLQVRANGNKSQLSASSFQLVPKITGLNATCLFIGKELQIYGSGLADGSAAAYVKIGNGEWHTAAPLAINHYQDGTTPTLIRTIIRPGDTSGQVLVRLQENGAQFVAGNVTVASVSVVNPPHIQQAIEGQKLIWGKPTLVQLQLKASGCDAAVDYADLEFRNSKYGTSQWGGRWDGGLTVKTTPGDLSLDTTFNIVTDFDVFFWSYPLSEFNGMSVTIKNKGMDVVGNYVIPASLFNFVDTSGVERHFRFMRVASPNSTMQNYLDFWYTATVNFGTIGRIYPQQTASPGHWLWGAGTKFQIPHSIYFDSVKCQGDGGNDTAVRRAVDDYLDPSGDTWAVALVDPAIWDETSQCEGISGGWAPSRTVLANNRPGYGGKTALHELLHAFGFVDSSAANYWCGSGSGECKHSRYHEGRWDKAGNSCDPSLTYRQALKDETGGVRRIARLASYIAQANGFAQEMRLDPCSGGSQSQYAKSIISYAPYRENANSFLEPLDYRTALAQLCVGIPSGWPFFGELYSKCPGFSVPSDLPLLLAQHPALVRAMSLQPTETATRTLRLSGEINVSDIVTTSVFYVAENDGGLTPQDITGTYHLIVRAADNTLLHDQRFDVPMAPPLAPHDDHGSRPAHTNVTNPVDVGFFHLRVPFPTNANKAEIRHNNTVIWQKSVSANAPSVSFITPNGGSYNADSPIAITWTASDADGDPLQFALDYSPDNGATWINVSPKLLGTSFSWTPYFVPSGTQARLRLRASDGFNSATATSNPFTLNAMAPEPIILAPTNGQLIGEGMVIALAGTSLTANGAGLGAFTWKQDGAVVGLTRTLTTTLNMPGVHTFTLQVVANGLSGTRSITVSVFADYDHDGMPDDWELKYGLNPLDPADALNDPDGDGLTNIQEYRYGTNPLVADTDGDGVNDGAEVAAGTDPLNPNSKPSPTPVLHVGAQSVGFTFAQGQSSAMLPQSTWVTNGGGGALNWTAAKDADWITVTPSSGGNGPTELVISANGNGLAVGSYVGHVTVTSAGAANSPWTIEVHLDVVPFSGAQLYLPIIQR